MSYYTGYGISLLFFLIVVSIIGGYIFKSLVGLGVGLAVVFIGAVLFLLFKLYGKLMKPLNRGKKNA